MSLISTSIPNLINGVSQQPPSLRLKTQAELQENALSSVVQGLVKRPNTDFLANLGPMTSPSTAFIHTIRRDTNEFYTLVISTDAIRVFDMDGDEREVTGDASYLAGLTNPSLELAATTVADYTFLLNKNVKVQMGSAKSPVRNPEGLIYVKQGDYRLNYTVKITKGGTLYTRSIETMSSTQDTAALTSNAERSIQTDRIATNLIPTNTTDATYYGSASAGITIDGLSFTQYGSVIHVRSTDGQDFKLEVEDSHGNQNIFGFKGTTDDFDKLPDRGPDGFVIKVLGKNDKGQDDYYVNLTRDDQSDQVWKECVAPNIETQLDAGTMPHQLVSNADGTFTLQQGSYAPRDCGDVDTNPVPSFVGLEISDIFFHRNRLGLLSDENVIFSEAGAFDEFNFFLRTTLTLLDSDVIDVAVSNNKVSILKHAIPFNESLLLFSDLTQFKLEAADLLTPETAQISVTTQFEADLESKPVGAGKFVFFATKRGDWAGVREYFVASDTNTNDAADITAHVPEYLSGRIRKMEASSNEDTLLVLTEDDPKAIYVYRYYWQGEEKLQSAWSRWTFHDNVLNVSFNQSEIYILFGDETNVYLEKMSLSIRSGDVVCLDSQVVLNENQLTLPYTAPESITYVRDDGLVLQPAEVAASIAQGYTVTAGIPYTFRYMFSEQVMKSEKDPITIGRLQLRSMAVVYSNTGYFRTEVTAPSREPYFTEFTGRVVGSGNNVIGAPSLETGSYRFPVLANSKQLSIELQSDSHLPCAFQSAEWEGFFTLKSRRL